MGSSGGYCKCCTPLVAIAILIVVSVLFVCLGAGSIPFLSKYYKDTVKKVNLDNYNFFPVKEIFEFFETIS